ncbi:MAG TPA: SpoIIE family protein phosphatase [Pyrinomonadaceae bacterium]|nr:SpoIIE family protein phosphatase [Pyrinomonadaceae bacterium]
MVSSSTGSSAVQRAALALSHDRSALAVEDKVRSLIREAADQLCRVVDGNLDFVVQVSESDDDVDKFLLLVNFVLATARRSLDDLSEVHRRVEEDLFAARKLQEKLLPEKLPNARNLRVGAKCVPARAVGGDFYDFFRYPRSELYVGLLGDVSGKGAAAAIYAALAGGIVRSLTDREIDPAAMLSQVSNSLFTRAPDGNFVALAYSTWDDENRVLEICNSGLPEPLLCRKGILRTLPIHGLPLGLFEDAKYDAMRIQCEPGDTFVFYTDGVVDEVDRYGKEFSGERLAEIISTVCHLSAAEIVEHIFEQVAKHCNCAMNHDDQTVVVVQVV